MRAVCFSHGWSMSTSLNRADSDLKGTTPVSRYALPYLLIEWKMEKPASVFEFLSELEFAACLC